MLIQHDIFLQIFVNNKAETLRSFRAFISFELFKKQGKN